MKIKKRPQIYERAAQMLRAVAHPTRIAIIEALVREGTLTVNEIKDRLATSQSMTSQHLGTLKNSGIVACEKEANACHYYILNKNILKLLECVEKCAQDKK